MKSTQELSSRPVSSRAAFAGAVAALFLTIVLTTEAVRAQDVPESDTATTRPLKLLMVGLGQDMNRISDGLWYEDYEMIRQGADAVAGHPRVPPEQMAAIQEALGPRFQQFVAFDRLVHDTAVALGAAAQRREIGRVMEEYAEVQQGCISCHAAFREEVRAALYGAQYERDQAR